MARAYAAMSRFDRLLNTLRAWHSTAQAIADGYTHDENLEWLDEPEQGHRLKGELATVTHTVGAHTLAAIYRIVAKALFW